VRIRGARIKEAVEGVLDDAIEEFHTVSITAWKVPNYDEVRNQEP